MRGDIWQRGLLTDNASGKMQTSWVDDFTVRWEMRLHWQGTTDDDTAHWVDRKLNSIERHRILRTSCSCNRRELHSKTGTRRATSQEQDVPRTRKTRSNSQTCTFSTPATD